MRRIPTAPAATSPRIPITAASSSAAPSAARFKKDKLFGFFAIERERENQGLAEDRNVLHRTDACRNRWPRCPACLVIPRPFYETRYNGRLDWTINSKNTAYVSYNSQANNSLNDQSDGTGDLTNGNYTTNHLQLANLTLNSVLSNTTVNQFTVGYQYWNNLIASNISAPLVIFPDASFGTNTNVPQQSFQRKWQFRDESPRPSASTPKGRRRLHLEPGGRRLLRVQLHAGDRLRRRPQRHPRRSR